MDSKRKVGNDAPTQANEDMVCVLCIIHLGGESHKAQTIETQLNLLDDAQLQPQELLFSRWET